MASAFFTASALSKMGHGSTRRGAGRPRGSSAPRVHAAPEPKGGLRAYARRYGHEAIDSLAKTMRGEKVPYSARVVAADRLLERGYGPTRALQPPESPSTPRTSDS